MKRFIYLLGISCLLYSCTVFQKKEDGLTVIDFGKNEKVKAAELFSLSFVKLETKDNALLGAVSQIKEADGRLILLDVFLSHKAYVFDREGKFISQLGNIGNGPGEYVIPSSCVVDEEKGVVSIIDPSQQKVIDYSLADYKFLSEKKVPFSSNSAERLSDDEWVWHNASYKGEAPYYGVYLTDNEFEIKRKLVELEFASGYRQGMVRKVYKHGETVFTYSHYSPILYGVKADVAYERFRFDFGEYQYPSLDFFLKEGANHKNYVEVLRNSSYVNYYEVHESDRFLCVPYFVDNTMYYGFYDKQNDKIYNYSQNEMQKDLQIGLYSTPVGTTSDGYFISLLNPGRLKDLKGNGVILNKELDALIETSTEDDNPILLFYK